MTNISAESLIPDPFNYSALDFNYSLKEFNLNTSNSSFEIFWSRRLQPNLTEDAYVINNGSLDITVAYGLYMNGLYLYHGTK
mmetsp:Transcript_12941/g.9372  ORF Transcript_12941/g.9372 Transcript_12941/m.9372 type:complete len:82 (-) Transcript_12941:74-319(-)|eukprot:CAMPEP_0202966446 /NCGR_PEP_ID=MMETSP1396-20130829/10847_1 /ASSEMBLY_ACC=CAM_ASM_000872 /TAXON_ID= /ORGANISM="Pseudokeronopsis sp., Strain Brazil" /LENGTH=81 /DNA_ID=CAMNT_0049690297 /DNA_START=105 /DNA_END=350 /DNA_ORIENTATION=+